MDQRSWIAMPVVAGPNPRTAARPKYSIEGNALLIHRGEVVYAALEDPGVVERITQLPDVRRLTPNEVTQLEAGFPNHGRLPAQFHSDSADDLYSGRVGLGDIVSQLTSLFGIKECGACARRRRTLNRATVWRSRASTRRLP